jgi:hypothetical protein
MPPVRQRLPLHRGRECRIGFEQVQRRRITLLVVIIGLALPASVHSALSPPDRVVAFRRLPQGSLPGIPRDVRKQARILSLHAGHRVAVAPTRNGNFCEAFSARFAGCRVRPAFGGHFGPMLGPTTMYRSGRLVAIGGDVVGAPEHSLYLVHGDGATRRIPLVYVTTPIGAGFFYARIPPDRRRGRKAPTRLQVRRGTAVVESQAIRARR